jgi:hypothetical protein
MTDDREANNMPDTKTAFHWLFWVVSGMAASLFVFCRYGMGRDFYRVLAPRAFVMLVLAACVLPAAEWQFVLIAFLVALAVQRVISGRIERRDGYIHSRDHGVPWLAYRVPFVTSYKIATGGIEPAGCFLLGIALAPLSPPLACYLLLAACALIGKLATENALEREQVQKLHDQEEDTRALAEQFRDRRGV